MSLSKRKSLNNFLSITSDVLALARKLSSLARAFVVRPGRALRFLNWMWAGPLRLAISFEIQYPKPKPPKMLESRATNTGPPITWELPPVVMTEVLLTQKLDGVLGYTFNPFIELFAQRIDSFSLTPRLLDPGSTKSKGPIPAKMSPRLL
jgi:hypothetical protein